MGETRCRGDGSARLPFTGCSTRAWRSPPPGPRWWRVQPPVRRPGDPGGAWPCWRPHWGLLNAAATGTLADAGSLRWQPGAAVTVVIAAETIPASRDRRRHRRLRGAGVLHAGTARRDDGAVVSGRPGARWSARVPTWLPARGRSMPPSPRFTCRAVTFARYRTGCRARATSLPDRFGCSGSPVCRITYS